MSGAVFQDRTRLLRMALSVAASVAVILCYWWIARTANDKLYWKYSLAGYYDFLGRGFLEGHLYLPIEPDPKLLAHPNPWDPNVQGPFKIWDLAFFNRRYYLYHGAGPAVMLFAPWRLLSGHDVPEAFAGFLFCAAGFLFSCAALRGILRLAAAEPPPALAALLVLTLGFCQSVPYLLNRIFVYEIAISGGFFSLSAAAWCLVRAQSSKRPARWLGASGLMFGIAIACRPHLGFAGTIVLVSLLLARAPRGQFAAFLAPFCLAGFTVAWYNYARFGNPFDFGITHLFSGPDQQRIEISLPYLPPGIYFFLFCRPDFSSVFPWIREAFRSPFDSLSYGFPHGYFIEPTIGALFLAPFLPGVLLLGRVPPAARRLIAILLISSGAIFLFLASTGFTTQRYEVDFLPFGVLASLATIAIAACHWSGWKSRLLRGAFTACAAAGIVIGLALGIAGPYNDLLKHWPHTYLHVARWFSPSPRLRPLLNPRVTVDLRAHLAGRPDGTTEPVVTMGHQPWRYFLFVRHQAGKMSLVSHTDESEVVRELEAPAHEPVPIGVTYAAGRVTVTIDGREVISHAVPNLLTAPAQVTPGENRIDPGITPARFAGRLETLALRVEPDSL